jgi:hypothetical protein
MLAETVELSRGNYAIADKNTTSLCLLSFDFSTSSNGKKFSVHQEYKTRCDRRDTGFVKWKEYDIRHSILNQGVIFTDYWLKTSKVEVGNRCGNFQILQDIEGN